MRLEHPIQAVISVTLILLVMLLVYVTIRNIDRSPQPCVVVGPAPHTPELVGPHLLVDCNGERFAVKVTEP